MGLLYSGDRGDSSLTIRGVTITGNTQAGISGADSMAEALTIVNSTIAGNTSGDPAVEPAMGLGITCGRITLRNVTISGNDRGLFVNDGCSGDGYTMQSTLIAGNTVDCSVSSITQFDGTTSLDKDGTCAAVPTTGGLVFATVPNPGLAPLADNGGPTLTMALSALSPAVDAGSSCIEPFDQRGAFRDAACDIGAFERATAVSMTSATGAGAIQVRVLPGVFSASAKFLTFHAVAEADMPNQAGKPAGVTFPYGFVAWSLAPLTIAGGTVDVEMTFPGPVPTPAQYWKVVNGIWTDVCLQIPCVANGNRLTITFRDGGIADLDGAANAVIVDPGGLGVGGNAIECHYVSIGLSPSRVAAGGIVHVAAGFRSCSTAAQTVVLRFTFAGPVRPNGCGVVKTTMLTTPPITVPPGFNRSLSFPFWIPRSTCAGDYSISAATLVNGSVVDSTTATLTVVR